MIFFRYSFFAIFLFLFSISGSSQILNYSTKNIYGPKTTRYFLERDVLSSIDTLYYLDTILTAFPRYQFTERHDYMYQDLGNKGTAIQPLFYQSPENIGFRSGYNVYDLYWQDLMKVRFYDTKSPYSKFHYVQGGRGTSILETEVSRNINANWNLGITYNRVSSNPQINFDPRPLRKEADHNSYSAYTAFKTKDGRYFVDTYVRRMSHNVTESGGVQVRSPDYGEILSDYLSESGGTLDERKFFEDYGNHARSLQSAQSRDLRFNFHLYHQFKFSDLIGVYHLFDIHKQTVSFEDNSSPYSQGFYKFHTGHFNYIDSAATPKESTIFKTYGNDIGLKGAVNELKYRIYYRRRSFFVDNYRLFDLKWQSEDYAGAEVALRFSERAVLHFNGEILGNSTYSKQAKDYQINFDFENRYINVVYKRMKYSPSYLQQIYFGNHNAWENNNFNATSSDDLVLSTALRLKNFEFIPRVKASRISDYIYFNNRVLPAQTSRQILIISPGLDLNFQLWKFKFRNSLTYSYQNEAGKDYIRIPEMMVNALIYFEQPITKKGHLFQLGFDSNWKSAYKADQYMPSIQQFFLQDESTAYPSVIKPFYLVNVFGAMKINRTRVFARLSNATQRLGRQQGYFVRPSYFGYVMVLDVGVHWMFFD